jgi:hypothetical protein
MTRRSSDGISEDNRQIAELRQHLHLGALMHEASEPHRLAREFFRHVFVLSGLVWTAVDGEIAKSTDSHRENTGSSPLGVTKACACASPEVS